MNSSILRPILGRRVTTYVVVSLLVVFMCRPLCLGQSPPAGIPESPLSNDLSKYPGLLPEFAHLLDKLQRNVQFPPPRSQSRILPLLPESTMFYGALPNYGDSLQQALDIFHQELQESAVLRDWWQHVNASSTAKPEDILQRVYEVSKYLGDEIVISGSSGGKDPKVLFVAEVRKPGLKSFLQQQIAELPTTPKPPVRILEPQDLAIAKDVPNGQPVVLIRPDFVIGATDVATLRSSNAQLGQTNASSFASSPFAQRLAREYEGGATVVGGVDLHSLLKGMPQGPQDKALALRQSGFGDMQYFIGAHRTVAGRELSEAELSFNGPRHGIASWLAPPRQLGSLDFVAPNAILAVTLALTSPAQIFDDVQELAASSNPSNPSPLTMAAPMAQAFGINLKDDLLNLLTGEIAIELDSATPPSPAWRLVLGVKDPAHFQRTLTTLMTASHMQAEQAEHDGITYYTVTVPSQARPVEIGYAFADGYLVVGSSSDGVAEAVRLHHGGGSLAKSQSFLASLPPGHASGISALFYEDPSRMVAAQLSKASPELASALAPVLGNKSPLVVCAYGEPTAIREATASTAFDPTAVLVVAAVAIPNLIRAKVAANDSSAVGTIRNINTAQVTYAASYPQRGFAPSLATLGVDPSAPNSATASHASLIDQTLGNPSCAGVNWCVKNGYRFRVTAQCHLKNCTEFVATATPISTNTGGRNFCSTSDGVIRFQFGAPLSVPATISQCKSWQPLQ